MAWRQTVTWRNLELDASAGRQPADPPTVEPSQVAVDKTAIEVDGERRWLYAAIDVDSELLLNVDLTEQFILYFSVIISLCLTEQGTAQQQ